MLCWKIPQQILFSSVFWSWETGFTVTIDRAVGFHLWSRSSTKCLYGTEVSVWREWKWGLHIKKSHYLLEQKSCIKVMPSLTVRHLSTWTLTIHHWPPHSHAGHTAAWQQRPASFFPVPSLEENKWCLHSDLILFAYELSTNTNTCLYLQLCVFRINSML